METSCILQCGDHCSASDSIDKITLKKWKNIEEQSKKLTGLDTFESVFAIADWKLGPAGLFMRHSCYNVFCVSRDQKKNTETACFPNYAELLHSEHGHLSNAIPFY